MFKEERAKAYRGLALCVAVFIVGRVLLDRVSTMENPVFGNTAYIVFGNLFMACALIGAGLIGRYLYRLRKRGQKKKSGSHVVFLNDEKKRHRSSERASS